MKKGIVGRFIQYYKPYRRTLFLDLFSAAVIGAVGVTFPIVLRRLTGQIFLLSDTAEMMRQIWYSCAFLLVLYIIEAVATYYMVRPEDKILSER